MPMDGPRRPSDFGERDPNSKSFKVRTGRRMTAKMVGFVVSSTTGAETEGASGPSTRKRRHTRTRAKDSDEEKERLKDMKSAVSGGWASYSEVWSWFMFDFANASYASVMIGLFLPLLMVYLAEEVACPYQGQPFHNNISTTCAFKQEVLNTTDASNWTHGGNYGNIWEQWTTTIYGDKNQPDGTTVPNSLIRCDSSLPLWMLDVDKPDLEGSTMKFRNFTMNTTALIKASDASSSPDAGSDLPNRHEIMFSVSDAQYVDRLRVETTSPDMFAATLSKVNNTNTLMLLTLEIKLARMTNASVVGAEAKPLWPWGDTSINIYDVQKVEPDYTFSVLVNKTKCYGTVKFIGLNVKAITFSTFVLSLSVFFQVFAFVSFASLGDHGSHRKGVMLFTSYAGGLITAGFLPMILYAPQDSKYVWAAFMTIASNVLCGLSIIMYNAFLPYLTLAHPEMKALTASGCKDTEEILSLYVHLEDEVSHKGFASGYVGGVLALIISIVMVKIVPGFLNYADTDQPWMTRDVTLGWIALFCGIWWAVCLIPAHLHLQPRPGPPLPDEYNKWGVFGWAMYGWKDTSMTLMHLPTLPHTCRYLIAFYLYSDTYSTVNSVGVLFCLHEFGSTMNFLTILALITPAFAAIGNITQMQMERGTFKHWEQKQFVIFNLCLYTAMFSYGLLGFIPGMKFGLVNEWEMMIFAGIHGFALGPIQSYSRTLLSELTPPGLESEFFGIFELTDKGSSWIGPMMCALIFELTNSMRTTLIYLVFMILCPMLFLAFFVDVAKGKEECRSLKTMLWVRRRRKHKKKENKKKKKAQAARAAGNDNNGSSVASSAQSSGLMSAMDNEAKRVDAKKNQVVPSTENV